MQLSLQNQRIGDVVVIRCQGRIVVGAEISSLQLELETLTWVAKKVILQLEEVSYIDSAGLGALVRLARHQTLSGTRCNKLALRSYVC
jgi:anti-anti-sigma factor